MNWRDWIKEIELRDRITGLNVWITCKDQNVFNKRHCIKRKKKEIELWVKSGVLIKEIELCQIEES